MAAPTLTATLDKAAYNQGDVMTLTVKRSTVTDNVTVSLGTLGITAQAVAQITFSVTVTDDQGKTWTKKSDDGSTAVYTATA